MTNIINRIKSDIHLLKAFHAGVLNLKIDDHNHIIITK